jgi:hypothetical protein
MLTLYDAKLLIPNKEEMREPVFKTAGFNRSPIPPRGVELS